LIKHIGSSVTPSDPFYSFPAILILEASPKTARLWWAVFGLQSGEFAPFGRELSALKLILRIADSFLAILFAIPGSFSATLDFACATRKIKGCRKTARSVANGF